MTLPPTIPPINLDILEECRRILVSYRFNMAMLPIPDGTIHRVHMIGDKPGTLNGWYALHNGLIPYAVWGSWRTGDHYKWHAGDPTTLSASDRKKMRQTMADAARRAEVFREVSQYAASWRAQKIWSNAHLASNAHPYLARKNVQSFGLREVKGQLLMPFYANGQLTTLQYISSDGTKRWLSGGKKKNRFIFNWSAG